MRFTPEALRGLLAACLLAATLAGCSAVAFQQPRPAPQPPATPAATPAAGERIERATSEPYTGDLAIFEDPARAEKLQVERVLDVLGVRDGTRVADIGAGSGWFTVRAARRAGAGGLVYAVEINEDFLRHIEERARKENLANVRAVLGGEDDPRLPPASVDAVLILKTYHEIAQPVRLLSRLRASLREGARVGIIDRRGDGSDHGVEREVVVREAERAGYRLAEEHDFVKGDNMDYFLVFTVRGR